MKQTIEVDIPEGYEYLKTIPTLGEDADPTYTVFFKPKQQKDFTFYVDEYLNVSGVSTIDQMSNWFNRDQQERIGNNLKTNQFSLVPWEIKIGLFKFICKENKMTFLTALNIISEYEHLNEWYITIEALIPSDFLDSIFDNKTK